MKPNVKGFFGTRTFNVLKVVKATFSI